MEIASWRPDFAKAKGKQGVWGFPLILKMGSTGSRARRERGETYVVPVVTAVCFKHTLRGKVNHLEDLHNQGSVSTGELGQFSTLSTLCQLSEIYEQM